MLVSGPGVLVVHPSLPARSVKELIAVAKSRPGEILYASPGNGTPPHLAAELFKSMAGVNIVHVPYKGNVQAMTDLIAGQESLSFPTGPSAMPHVQAKRLRAPDIVDKLLAQGLEPAPNTPDEFARFIAAELAKWNRVIAAAGVKVE
jgi:tripartite-type tricarboxylate transporter receptor subunit TctC